MDGGLITVTISIGLVVIIIVVSILAFRSWQRNLAAAALLPCALMRDSIFPDLCVGTCPPGQGCGAVTTRAYLIFFTQHATCACAVGVTPVVTPPGGPGGGGGTGDEPR